MIVVYILLAALFAEGMTELVVKSKIFAPLREKLQEQDEFFRKLLTCGYCASVWAATLPAAFLVWCLGISQFSNILSFVFLTVIIHRLSNYFHNINDKYFDKYYSNKER